MFMANVNLGLMMGFVQERLPEILIGESKSPLNLQTAKYYMYGSRHLSDTFHPPKNGQIKKELTGNLTGKMKTPLLFTL